MCEQLNSKLHCLSLDEEEDKQKLFQLLQQQLDQLCVQEQQVQIQEEELDETQKEELNSDQLWQQYLGDNFHQITPREQLKIIAPDLCTAIKTAVGQEYKEAEGRT